MFPTTRNNPSIRLYCQGAEALGSFANNNAPLFHSAVREAAGRSQGEIIMWIAAVQFEAA